MDAEPGLVATLKRTATEFMEDSLSDWATALTYYGLLAEGRPRAEHEIQLEPRSEPKDQETI